MPDLSAVADRLAHVDHYTEIFPDPDLIRDIYRDLAQVVHPDRAPFGQVALSTVAFQKLNQLKAEAEQMVAEGRFGQRRVLATITSRKGRYEVTRAVADGDLTKLWLTSVTNEEGTSPAVLKVAKSPKDNDLVAQEARALKKLHAPLFDEDGEIITPPSRHVLTRHFPELHDTFLHSEGRRRANVLSYHEGFYPLDKVIKWSPHGLPPEHLAWVWRRVLMALGYAHDQGIVHGAVLPPHILIHPESHGVLLIDWCYSVVIDSESITYVKAVVPMFKQGYPEEVLNKDQPGAATDLYMAAQTMLWSSTKLPKAMKAYFEGTKLSKQSMRPQNAWLLLEEFDDLLKVLGHPFYPRRFVPLTAPAV